MPSDIVERSRCEGVGLNTQCPRSPKSSTQRCVACKTGTLIYDRAMQSKQAVGITTATLWQQVRHNSNEVRRAVALGAVLGQAEITQLSEDRSYRVREAVALRYDLSDSAGFKLACDGDKRVRLSVAKNGAYRVVSPGGLFCGFGMCFGL